jgi:uncharacterized Tic20 family protein
MDAVQAGNPSIEGAQRNIAMGAHLSALTVFFGIPPFIGPLVVWLTQRERSPFVDAAGKEAVNFNLSATIYFAVSAVLSLLLVGIPMLIAVAIGWLVLTVIAAIKAGSGESYRYPLTIRFIR